MSGEYPPVHHCPSPNFGSRRNGLAPDLVVLHYTGMETAADAFVRLCSTEHEVSAHYLIEESGRILQLVSESKRAWHAGEGAWGGSGDVNSRSVGIEIANSGSVPYAAAQIAALESLLPPIMKRWGIRPEGVIGHSDIAIARKRDPGPRLDWRRLALLGLSVWPETRNMSDIDGERFLLAAKIFGYSPPDGGAFPERVDEVLKAFRLRFFPWEAGSLNARDMAAVQDLARRFPARRRAVKRS